MNKCLMCGKKIPKSAIIHLPHGQIPICNNFICREHLNFKVNKGIPIVWFFLDELSEGGIDIHPSALKLLEDKDIARKMGINIADTIWREDFGNMYQEAIETAAENLEIDFIKGVEDSRLPLLNIDDLGFQESKGIMEDRLKGNKDEQTDG